MSQKFDYGQKKDTFEEISRYLSALKGNTSRAWKAFESIWAGTHIHVGLEIPPTKEVSRPRVMRVLQHPAYILTSYEDLLTQLHPIHRSGDGAEYHANRMISPIMRLEGETEELQAERTSKAASAAHRSHHELASNAEAVARAAQQASGVGVIIWSDMRDTVFQEKLRIDSLIEMLHHSQAAGTIANRGFFVNRLNLSNYRWSETKNKPAKPTIEFRQHACSLDPDEMQHWVDLIFAVMRVLEAKAMQTTKFSGDLLGRNTSFADREGRKYRINDQRHRGTIEEFYSSGLLDIHSVEMDYWRSLYETCKRDMRSLPWG